MFVSNSPIFLPWRQQSSLCAARLNLATRPSCVWHFIYLFFGLFNPKLNPCGLTWTSEKETVCKRLPCQNQRRCGLLDAWYYRTEDRNQCAFIIWRRLMFNTAVHRGAGACVGPVPSLSETAPDAWTPSHSLNNFVKSRGLAGTRRSSTIRLISSQREQMDADIERVASHLIWRGSATEQKALNKVGKTPQQTEGCYRNSSARKIQSLSSSRATEKCWKRLP